MNINLHYTVVKNALYTYTKTALSFSEATEAFQGILTL